MLCGKENLALPKPTEIMSGIFLSHSSKDKDFVARLAIDLVSEGFPVWFDSWEIEIGDSLIDRIYQGIDDSTFLVVLLSENSVGSTWVRKELKGALVKEERLGRKFILPVKISECDVPLEIADRIYADFATSYLSAVEGFTSTLRKFGASEIEAPLDKQLIPLRFSKGLYLNQVLLQNRIDQLPYKSTREPALTTRQIVLAPEPEYDALRQRIMELREDIHKLESYSPELERRVFSDYERIKSLENVLREGVIMIINGLLQSNNRAFVGESCHWFARIIRSYILGTLRQYLPENEDAVEFGSNAIPNPLGNNVSIAKFYGVESIISCDIWKEDSSREYTKVYIDRDSWVAKELEMMPGVPDPLNHFMMPEFLSKYLVPQMIFRHFYAKPSLVTWNFKDCMMGLA